MKRAKSIILILTVMALSFVMTGCGAFSIFKSGGDSEAVVKEFLSAVSKDDTEKAKACLVDPASYQSLTSIARELGLDEDKTKKFADQYTSIKFSIEDSEKGSDNSKATVIVHMTVPDYSASFAQGVAATTKDMNSGQAMKVVIEKMAEVKPETVRKAVAVSVVKNGDKWLIDYSNNNLELVNAINGNILNALHGSLAV